MTFFILSVRFVKYEATALSHYCGVAAWSINNISPNCVRIHLASLQASYMAINLASGMETARHVCLYLQHEKGNRNAFFIHPDLSFCIACHYMLRWFARLDYVLPCSSRQVLRCTLLTSHNLCYYLLCRKEREFSCKRAIRTWTFEHCRSHFTLQQFITTLELNKTSILLVLDYQVYHQTIPLDYQIYEFNPFPLDLHIYQDNPFVYTTKSIGIKPPVWPPHLSKWFSLMSKYFLPTVSLIFSHTSYCYLQQNVVAASAYCIKESNIPILF